MAAPIMQLRIFHRNFSRTAKDCARTGKNLRNFRKLGKSLAFLGILELSCQGLGILELSWQGLKSTGVSVREKQNRLFFLFIEGYHHKINIIIRLEDFDYFFTLGMSVSCYLMSCPRCNFDTLLSAR